MPPCEIYLRKFNFPCDAAPETSITLYDFECGISSEAVRGVPRGLELRRGSKSASTGTMLVSTAAADGQELESKSRGEKGCLRKTRT